MVMNHQLPSLTDIRGNLASSVVAKCNEDGASRWRVFLWGSQFRRFLSRVRVGRLREVRSYRHTSDFV